MYLTSDELVLSWATNTVYKQPFVTDMLLSKMLSIMKQKRKCWVFISSNFTWLHHCLKVQTDAGEKLNFRPQRFSLKLHCNLSQILLSQKQSECSRKKKWIEKKNREVAWLPLPWLFFFVFLSYYVTLVNLIWAGRERERDLTYLIERE